jgi:hypothetical protein
VNRNLWASVAGAIVVMGGLEYAANPNGGVRQAVALVRRAAPAGAALVGRASGALSWEVVGLLVAAALVMVLVARRRRRPTGLPEPWRRVVLLGRQGRPPATVARLTRQSQDAVRIVLAPVAVDRPPAEGKPFRSNDPGRGRGAAAFRLPWSR